MLTIFKVHSHNTHTTVLRPFFRDHPGEPVPEENFWTLWSTSTIPPFFTGRMPFLPPNQQRQSTEDKSTEVHKLIAVEQLTIAIDIYP